MYTELKLHKVSPERLLKDYVDRRLNFAMRRFCGRVSRVTTRITVPAAASSADLLCHIKADLTPFGVITAEASNSDVYAAVDRRIGRLARRCHRNPLDRGVVGWSDFNSDTNIPWSLMKVQGRQREDCANMRNEMRLTIKENMALRLRFMLEDSNYTVGRNDVQWHLLEEEIERAEIVPPHDLPADVVTTHSRTRIVDMRAG